MDMVREEAWPLAAPAQQQPSAPPPQPPVQQQNGRIDLRELKLQMEKRLGPERSRRYFSYLKGYLSERLSKADFDKMCLLTLGRENLRLHNRLIRSVLYNAYHAKCPPPAPSPDVGRSVGATVKKASQANEALNSCNGDIRLLQMQGSRHMGTMQDHQSKDRLKSMGLSCRAEAAASHNQSAHGGAAGAENGTLSSPDLKRSVHFQRESADPLAKHQRVEQLPTGNIIKLRRSMSNVSDHSAEASNSPLRAPLGIPFCPVSVGGARKLPPPISADEDQCTSCCEHHELLNTELLHRRMEKTAESLGLAGVTLDCADLLNSGLDKYLKNLIRSSVELIGANVQNDARKGALYKQHSYGKNVNGVWLPNHVQMQSSSGPSGAANDIRSNHLISIDDFKVAMQLNPQQLGEDWPVLLEKICLCSPEEND
ncbi:uncharacterized protein LOC102718262 [Oryza brachyantha]|uniref:Transcriptional coactivator Hfi1/Transcriptional adapter 1 n=1 Tax=Oryza brachyantha TaxID=4533 RepID=J3M283_ORYBR|nr:uncharacterized protein LOC102718262 [Oryza brachyantha]